MESQVSQRIQAEQGFSQQQIADILAIYELVFEEEDAVDAVLVAYGITPGEEEEEKVIQLLALSAKMPQGFDETWENAMPYKDFSIGLFKGIFDRARTNATLKGNGTKLGNLLGSMFMSKKKKTGLLMEKMERGEQLTPEEQKFMEKIAVKADKKGGIWKGIDIAGFLAKINLPKIAAGLKTVDKNGATPTPDEDEEKDKKKKEKEMMYWIGAGAGLLILIVAVVLIARATRKKK